MAYMKANFMDDWNPMEEDFNSVAFNSYDRGQGRAVPIDRLPSWKKRVSPTTHQTVTLHVSNIPAEVKESGLFNIFSNCGEVLRVYRSHPREGKCFGFIDYDTLKEAELAIREVDGRPPLRLRVSFSMTKQDRQDQNKLKEVEMSNYLKMTLDANDKYASSKKKMELWDRGSITNSVGREELYSLEAQRPYPVKGIGRGAALKHIYDYNHGFTDNLSNEDLHRFRITATNQGREISYLRENTDQTHYTHHCCSVNHCKSDNCQYIVEHSACVSNAVRVSSHHYGRASGQGMHFHSASSHDHVRHHCGELPLSSSYYSDQENASVKSLHPSFNEHENMPSRNELVHASYIRNQHTVGSEKPILRRPYFSNFQGNGLCENPPGDNTDSFQILTSSKKLFPFDECKSNLSFHPNMQPVGSGDGLLPTPQWRGQLHFEQNGLLPMPSQMDSNQNTKTYSEYNLLQLAKKADASLVGRERFAVEHASERTNKLKRNAILEKAKGGPCENCRKFGTSCCSACKVWYCSRECQVEHWPIHQKSCSKTSISACSTADGYKDQGFDRHREDQLKKNEVNATIAVQQKEHHKQDTMRNKSKPNEESDGQKILRKTRNEQGRSSELSKSASNSNKENKPDAPQQQTLRNSQCSIEKQMELKYDVLDTTFTKVKVCSGFSPEDIWLHKIPEAEINIEKLSKLLKQSCEKASCYHPKVGEICGAFYLVDKSWCRVRINEVGDKECSTYFVDFGNTEVTPISDIRRLSNDFLSLPAQAIACRLDSIQPVQEAWCSKAIQLLGTCLCNGPLKARAVTVLNQNKYGIELIDAKDNLISEILIKSGYAKKQEKEKLKKDNSHSIEQSERSPKEIKDGDHKTDGILLSANSSLLKPVYSIPSLIPKLPVGEQVPLAIAFTTHDDNTDFWAHPIIDETYEIMEKLQKLNEYSTQTKDRSFCAKLGDVVAAQSLSDEIWYRAYILGIEASSYCVRYIDYGNEEQVTTVAPLPCEFGSLASITIHCQVNGTLSQSSKVVFKNHIVDGRSVSVKVTSVNDNEVSMDLMNPENENILCSLNGNCWFYDTVLPSNTSVKKEEQVSQNNTEQPVVRKKLEERKEGSITSLPSVMMKLKAVVQVELAVAFAEEGKTDFWTHPLLDETYEIMGKLAKLNESAKSLKDGDFSPNPGDIICAQSITDGFWYRAYILHKKNESYYVRYIDYGNEENVISVIPLAQEYAVLPSLVVHCSINNNHLVASKLVCQKHTVGASLFVKITSADKSKICMDLINPEEENSVMCSMEGYPWYQDLGFPASGTSENSSKAVSPLLQEVPLKNYDKSVLLNTVSQEESKKTIAATPSIITSLQNGTEVTLEIVFATNDKSEFWVHPVIDEICPIMEKLMTLEEFKNSIVEDFCPNSGDVVIALSAADSSWYRACILQSNLKSYNVQYIDFGNKEEVTTVIPIPLDYVSMPSLAIHCVLNGKLSSADELIITQNVTIGNSLFVKIISVEENKIEMVLLHPEEKSVVCTLTGHSWYYDMKKYTLCQAPDTTTTNVSAIEAEMPLTKCPQLNAVFTLDNSSKRKEISSCPSVIANFQKGSNIPMSIVVSVEGQTDFWAQPLVKETGEIMEKLMKVEEHVKNMKDDEFCPSAGDFVIALSPADGCWYRAYVLETSGEFCKVRYIDYGNEEEVTKVAPLLEQYASVPSLAVHCVLHDSLSSSNEQSFKELVNVDTTVTVKIVSKEIDKIEMHLIRPNDNSVTCLLFGYPWHHGVQKFASEVSDIISDSTIVKQLGSTEALVPSLSEPNDSSNDNETVADKSKGYQDEESKESVTSIIKKLQKDSDISLAVAFLIEGRTDFWAQPLISETGEIMKQLIGLNGDTVDAEDKNFSPVVGDIVAALSEADGCCYRAYILQIKENKYYVRYIDYGNEEEVAKIVPLLPEYASMPSLTVHCFLYENLSADNAQVFKNIVCIDNSVTVRITSVESNKIQMNLINPNNKSVVCTLIGYPWHHDIQEHMPLEVSELVSDSKMSKHPVTPDSSIELKDMDKKYNIEENQESKKTEFISPVPSIFSSLSSGLEMTLVPVVVLEDDFWFHIATDGSYDIMEKLSQFDNYIKRLKIKEFCAKVGNVVIAQSLADDCWYRAYILGIEESKYKVRFIDYGNEESVLLVVPPLSEHITIPSLIVHCFISENLSPEKQQLARKYVVENNTLISAKIVTVDESSIEMDLLDKENSTHICKLIGYPWYHGLSSVNNEDKHLSLGDEDIASTISAIPAIPEKQEIITDVVDSEDEIRKTEIVSPVPSIFTNISCGLEVVLAAVVVLEDSFWFHMGTDDSYEIMEKLNEFNSYVKNLKDKECSAKIGDIVIAQSPADSCWYRAYVLGIKENEYTVRYIDYGNEECVLLVVPPLLEHITIPSLIAHCFICENLSLEKKQLATKHIVENATQLLAKIVTVNQNSVEMDLLNKENGAHICRLVGYPWYHGLASLDNGPEQLISVNEETSTLSTQVIPEKQDLVNGVITNEEKRLSVPSVLHSLQVNTDSSVFVVKSDSKQFSAVLGEKEALQEIVELEENMAKKYNLNYKNESSFTPGDIVAAYSSTKLCWHRACVLKVSDSLYSVRYIDYGEEETVAVIHFLEEKHCFIPSPLVFCTMDEIHADLLATLQKIITCDAVLGIRVISKKGDQLHLQLKIPDKDVFVLVEAHAWNYDVDKSYSQQVTSIDSHMNDGYHNSNAAEIGSDAKIYENGEESENKNLSSVSICTHSLLINSEEKYIDQPDGINSNSSILENSNGNFKSNLNGFSSVLTILKSGREVKLSLVSSSDEKFKFWACVGDIETMKAIFEMQASIAGEESQELTPQIGDIIAAKSQTDGEWYRAYVLKDDGKSLQVRYIDYGNEETVTKYKTLCSAYLNLLSPALYCIVEDTSISISVTELEKLLVVDSTILVKVCNTSTDKVQLSVITDNGAPVCSLLGLPWYHDLIPLLLSDNSNEIDVLRKDTEFCAMYSNIEMPSVSSIDNADVQVVFIKNLQNLFLQNISHIPKVSKLVCDITEHCKNLPLNSYEPKIDEMVCANFHEDGKWYRGCVKSINTTEGFMIHFVDFGNDEKIDSKCLRPLPEHFTKFPAYAICVSLELPPILPTVKVREILQDQVWNVNVINAETACVKLVNHKDISVVEVLKGELSLDAHVNDKVAMDKTVNISYADCQIVDFPISEVTIVVMSIIAPDAIFCCLADGDNILALEKLNNDITTHCTKVESADFCPEIGEVCLAKYSSDRLWYRAVPLQYVNKSIQMLFVDFGNIEDVKPENTRPMIQKFVELPLQAVHCALSEIPLDQEWSTDAIQLLLSVMPQQKPIKVNVIEKKNDIYIIDIPGVAAQLKRKSLSIS